MMKYIALALCTAVVTTNVVFGAPVNEKCKKKKKNFAERIYDSCDECKKKNSGGNG